MFISFFRYLIGYVKILIKGYSPERFINLCKNKNINIWGLESTKDGYVLCMKISDFRKLKGIIKKTQTKACIQGRFGLPFVFHKYRKRKLFFIGLFIAIFLVYCMTFVVWKIDFVGNKRITDEVILEYLETIHVSQGMKTWDVKCEEIARRIRNDFDDIIWVSVSLEGTNLTIHIREKDKTFQPDPINEVGDLVSDKQGIVTNIITRKGTPMVQVGDEIKEGDVLVSGTIPVLNDAKELIANHYVTADADIWIERDITYEQNIEKKYTVKSYTNKKKTLRYLKLGERIVYLGSQKNPYKRSEQFIQEEQLKIGGDFYLPICYGKIEYFEYKIISQEYGNEEMETLLKEDFLYYLENLAEENVKVLSSSYQIVFSETGAKIHAVLKTKEEVGVTRKNIDLSTSSMVE